MGDAFVERSGRTRAAGRRFLLLEPQQALPGRLGADTGRLNFDDHRGRSDGSIDSSLVFARARFHRTDQLSTLPVALADSVLHSHRRGTRCARNVGGDGVAAVVRPGDCHLSVDRASAAFAAWPTRHHLADGRDGDCRIGGFDRREPVVEAAPVPGKGSTRSARPQWIGNIQARDSFDDGRLTGSTPGRRARSSPDSDLGRQQCRAIRPARAALARRRITRRFANSGPVRDPRQLSADPARPYRGGRSCNAFADKAFALANTAEISTVVLIAQWTGYFSAPALRVQRSDGSELRGAAAAPAALEGLADIIRALRAAGKRVVLVLNIPVAPELAPRSILERRWSGSVVVRGDGMSRDTWSAIRDRLSGGLASAAREAGATLIDPADFLCDSLRCPALERNGVPRYHDGYHLRASFVRDHVGYLDSVILGAPR